MTSPDSPAQVRGRDERSSLLEGRGEGLHPRMLQSILDLYPLTRIAKGDPTSPRKRSEVKEAPSSLPRIQRVAQAVADQVERQHHKEDREPRPDRHPGGIGQEALGDVQHAAPGWRRRLLTEAEEG
jgi:hypothetical protein